MKDCLLIGMALGVIAGALIVTNNPKAKELAEKGKKAIKKHVEKI